MSTVMAIPPVTARLAADIRLTQARVVRSEWSKLWSLRSTVWGLAGAVVALVGFGLLFSGLQTSGGGNSDTTPFDPTAASLGGLFLVQLIIAVLGVLAMSGEFATGEIRSSLAAVPKRLPVLWAKGIVYAGVTFGLMIVGVLAAFLGGQALLSGKGIGLSLFDGAELRAVVGAALYLTVVGLFGLGLGTLLRRTASAIAVVVGLLMVLPLLANALPASWQADLGPYLPGTAGQAVVSVRHAANTLSPWIGFAVFCGYAAAVLAIAAVALIRRDV